MRGRKVHLYTFAHNRHTSADTAQALEVCRHERGASMQAESLSALFPADVPHGHAQTPGWAARAIMSLKTPSGAL
eukprot:6905670-Alexandrium_andersonii.AAC.1